MKVCKVCHAVCPEKHWHYDERFFEAYHDAKGVQSVECEGCHRIKVKDYSGTVYIEGDVLSKKKDELLRLIKNEEKIDKPEHYLSRIFDIVEEKNRLVVHTLNQRLALNIGMQLKKTFRGKLHILKEGERKMGVARHSSHKDEVVVKWEQTVEKEKKVPGGKAATIKAAAKKAGAMGAAKASPTKKTSSTNKTVKKSAPKAAKKASSANPKAIKAAAKKK